MKPFLKSPSSLLICAFAAAGAVACGGSSSDPSGTTEPATAGKTADAGTTTSTQPDASAGTGTGTPTTTSDPDAGTTATTTGAGTGGTTGGGTTNPPTGGGTTTPPTGGTGGTGGGTTGGGGGTSAWMSVVGFEGFFSQTFDEGAQTWADATVSTRSIRAISCVGTTVGWAAGDGGWIGHTADSGASWHAETSTTAVDLHGIRFSSTTFGVVVGDRGTIEVTTDGGETWSARSSGTAVALRGVALGYGAAFVVGDSATLVRSTDGGASWTTSTIAGASDLTSVTSDDTAGIVLVTDAAGNVFVSHDKGDSFQRELTGAGHALSSVYVAKDGRHALAVGLGGSAFVRDDAGAWTMSARATSVDLHAALVADHGTLLLAAGEEGTLLESRSFGATWTVRPLATKAALYGLDDAW